MAVDSLRRLALVLVAFAAALSVAPAGADDVPLNPKQPAAAGDTVTRVIVRAAMPASAARADSPAEKAAIADAQARVLRVAGPKATIHGLMEFQPLAVLSVDAASLERLRTSPEVAEVQIDHLFAPALSESVPLIGATPDRAANQTGAGQVIAVLDTGVDRTHPMLAGKVVFEGCYSTNNSSYGVVSLCPGGTNVQEGSGAAAPCSLSSCAHGTHVAGIAAGKSSTLAGVARDANVIAMQVFTRFNSTTYCGGASSCVLSFTSDQIRALERVYALRTTYSIAAVNMSLGGSQYSDQATCDGANSALKSTIDLLKSAGIATVVASGNNGYTNALTAPGCISSAVAVGATTKSDTIASYSNSSAMVDLLAPGSSIRSALPGGSTGAMSGTSMATPHVAGAFAILRQAAPSATVDQLTAKLQATGRPVADTRSGGLHTRPRIDVGAAVAAFLPTANPAPSLAALEPASATAGSGGLTLTVSGTNFVPGAVLRWNGNDRPTTVVSASRVTAAIPASDLASAGTATITVLNPTPGGGTSNGLTFTVTPPAANPVPTLASLAPASRMAGAGGFTLSVAGSNFVPGAVVRWNGSDRPTTHISANQLSAAIPAGDVAAAGTISVTVANPAPGGGSSNSLPFSVLPSAAANPQPSLTSLSPSTRPAGSDAFTLTVTGTGFVQGSVVRWNGSDRPTTFISGTQLRAAIPATDVASVGSASVGVFTPAPGGGLSNTRTFTIAAATNPVPRITGVTPGSARLGAASVTIAITGSGFVPGSGVRVGWSERVPVYVSPTELRLTLTADDLLRSGWLYLRVVNPGPGGGLSNTAYIRVSATGSTGFGTAAGSALLAGTR